MLVLELIGEAVYLDFAAAIQLRKRTGIHKRIGC
jgi:hypothetical protein